MGIITTQQQRLYLMGTCNATFADPTTGALLHQENKITANDLTTEASETILRAGMDNGVATVFHTDSTLRLSLTAAAFSLWGKGAALGSDVSYNGIVPDCQVVTATGAALSIDVASGAPVAPYGYSAPFCYVTTVGQANTVASAGVPYPIAANGAISGFTAVAGTSYQVFYWHAQATAQVVDIKGNFEPKVVSVTLQRPIYTNVSTDGKGGNLWGWLYEYIPLMQLTPADGGISGDQTTAVQTVYSGLALTVDEAAAAGTCAQCIYGSVAYYVLVPNDVDAGLEGLAVIGGNIDIAQGATVQIPVKAVVNGQLASIDPTLLAYQLTTAPTGVSVSASGVLTATGAATGAGEVTITYPKTGAAQFTTVANIIVG